MEELSSKLKRMQKFLGSGVQINMETVSCPCNTCFWYARALAIRNTSQGGADWRISYSQRVSIFIANLHAIFNDILRKNHGTLLYCGLQCERVCLWGVFINLVRPLGSTPFLWVIFCHITLERSWDIGFCLHFCWMYVATAITYSEPSLS